MQATRRHLLGGLAALCALGGLSRPAAAGVKEINISYVKAPFNLQSIVMRRRQLLEKEFAADGITVTWHDLTTGPQQTQAMAAGALDIGGVLNTASVLMANASGNPVRIAAGVSRPARTFAILGKAGGPAGVRDLKGKSVAGPKGTVLHQLLVAALAREGLSVSDVEFINMDLPKTQAALLAGQVDAGLLAASLVIKSVAAGARVIATADGLVSPLLVMGVRDAFAREQPELLARVVKVHREAMALIEADREAAIALGAEEQGISLEEARTLAQWTNLIAVLEPTDVEAMAADVRFLLENGMLKQPVDPKALLLPLAMG
ncbi:ABC transporter substrate-binding protein [Azospirillum thermophilum]|uniref:Aliphatic sulfonate ABC transporter n=1 Tax=Azospirillum thermophilum TaxID=2202148 RepID=A0A2S2CYU0_9PROT|nr:NrtA/SsuA/CpmA family ABC transporter substrate-binding protein [Azospirillum thermophilum]AWK89682.1 aliphatic sulfonate ABC transporter [Azospirillum thermophilum]